MAQLIRRISGQPRDSDTPGRATSRFPDTREGRRAAEHFAKTLDVVRVAYDVRVRIDGRVVTKTFPTRKAADAWAMK